MVETTPLTDEEVSDLIRTKDPIKPADVTKPTWVAEHEKVQRMIVTFPRILDGGSKTIIERINDGPIKVRCDGEDDCDAITIPFEAMKKFCEERS